ncbi:MAG: cytochrome c oxidase subunit II [Armatimonadetes bacterium]|nr:cytochrome c oxidase subunit II [Armatimonadota bacterium]
MNSGGLMPEQASNFAQEMDLLYYVLIGLTVFFALLVFVPMLYFVVKYRAGSKADRTRPTYHNLKLELAWSLIPLAMGLVVFVWGAKLFVEMYTPLESENALQITVVGKQWMWHLQHPTGQRENNELHIPTGRPIQLTMISQDVIHSFFVPAFRIKRDVLPGRYVTMWFEATKTGRYHLYCAEYCGTDHAKMTGWVYVMKPEEYERWLVASKWGAVSDAARDTMAEAGERLYNDMQCNSCHDPAAQNAPSLAGLFGKERRLSDGRVVTAGEDYIRRSIYKPNSMKVIGYEPIMPTYEGLIDEQEVLQLIAYIRSVRDEADDLTGRETTPEGDS